VLWFVPKRRSGSNTVECLFHVKHRAPSAAVTIGWCAVPALPGQSAGLPLAATLWLSAARGGRWRMLEWHGTATVLRDSGGNLRRVLAERPQ